MASAGFNTERQRRPPLERTAQGTGPSAPPPVPSALETAVRTLRTPVALGADPAEAAAELETARQRILDEALEVAASRR